LAPEGLVFLHFLTAVGSGCRVANQPELQGGLPVREPDEAGVKLRSVLFSKATRIASDWHLKYVISVSGNERAGRNWL